MRPGIPGPHEAASLRPALANDCGGSRTAAPGAKETLSCELVEQEKIQEPCVVDVVLHGHDQVPAIQTHAGEQPSDALRVAVSGPRI